MTCVRLISSNRNMVIGDTGSGTGRGKGFVRNGRGVGNGRGGSSCVQNKGFLIGPAKQLCDTTKTKTRAKISGCHRRHGITSNIIALRSGQFRYNGTERARFVRSPGLARSRFDRDACRETVRAPIREVVRFS